MAISSEAELIELMTPILRAIARGLGPSCEASLTRFTAGGEGVILAIENGGVTGRRVGDPAADFAPIGDEAAGGPAGIPRIVTGVNGREFRCVSAHLPVAGGMAAGHRFFVTVVVEVTVAGLAAAFLGGLLEAGGTGQEGLRYDLRAALPSMLKEAEALVGRPISMMNRDEKLKVIRELDSRGAFLLRNSVEDVARALQVSRFTVYNYLDDIRQSQPGEAGPAGEVDPRV
ncbi:MAG: helix-turn-helix domain-containing protein [Ignavibacteriales bacterium]